MKTNTNTLLLSMTTAFQLNQAKMNKIAAVALFTLFTNPSLSMAQDIYGSAAYVTARSCTSVTAAEACDGGGLNQNIYDSELTGGPSATADSSLDLGDGSSVLGSVSFGASDLPVIRASSISSLYDRMNSNDIGYQSYTYLGSTPSDLSYQANLHIDNSSTDGSTGVYPGGAIYTDYVAIWDPTIVGQLTSADDIFNNVFEAPCGTPGVLAVGSGYGSLGGGEATLSVTTTSCLGGPLVVTPGEQILAVAALQIPTNRGGFIDATHTMTVEYDPALGAATIANLQKNLISAESVSSAPEPSSWALMLVGVGLVGAAIRLGRRFDAAVAA